MGAAEVLTIIFVVLKLTHAVDWNWFWVFSPMVFTYSFALVMFMVIVAIGGTVKFRGRVIRPQRR